MTIDVDVLIFGGGAAGLWLLDELRRRGRRALLLEAAALGAGQTVAAQGINHGGLKYTLAGALTGSARAIREMPERWRRCLAGEREPDLSGVKLRGEGCHLWRTGSLRSMAGMIGARAGLRSAPRPVADEDRPAPLAGCPGAVYRVDEPVIDTVSFLGVMRRRNLDRLLRIDPGATRFRLAAPGRVETVELGWHAEDRSSPEDKPAPVIQPTWVVLTAGAGNAGLRERLGLAGEAMQLRPLHMTLLRSAAGSGNLPVLNGHCVEGAATRVTINSALDRDGRVVWQVGGEAAEAGVAMSGGELIRHVKAELRAVMPGLSLDGVEWAAYRVDRAEGAMPGGRRPEEAHVQTEGEVITGWPTKLALAPYLADRVIERLGEPAEPRPNPPAMPAGDGPRPAVARPPWEQVERWISDP